jgi:hypothetical protein
VKFELLHTFQTDLATFERALFDPRLLPLLERSLDAVRTIERLERSDDGRSVRLRTRYVPAAELPSFARGKLQPEMLEWVEEATYDRDQHRFDYRILPNIPERWHDRFRSQGSYTLVERGGEVARTIDGEVAIKVALVGGMAERYVIGQVKKNFDQEAGVLRDFLKDLDRAA